MNTVRDYVASVVRTVTPWLAGAILTWLALHGLHLTLPAGATTLLVGAASAGYYAAVRAAEHRWPKVGWLLGLPVAPVYASTVPPTPK